MRSIVRMGLLVGVCIVLAILAACRRPPGPPVTYRDLCNVDVQHLETMDEDSVRQWVREQYGVVPRDAAERSLGGDLVGIMVWTHDGVTGNAYLRDGHLFRISLMNIKNGPTFNQVIAGMGIPQAVGTGSVQYDPVLYSIDLFYPELGMLVSGSRLERYRDLMRDGGLAARLGADMRVDSVDCYAPASIPDVLRKVYFSAPERVAGEVQHLRPWPGFGAWVPLDR